jgi:hypothetical protein
MRAARAAARHARPRCWQRVACLLALACSVGGAGALAGLRGDASGSGLAADEDALPPGWCVAC